MSKRTLIQLKAWFEKEDKPTQAQFWDWLDSFFHKDDNIPSAQVEGLQGLLDSKVDKKDLTSNKGVWDENEAYVFDANQAQYVSFVNPDSTNDFFTTERWFRLDADTIAGQSPETHPDKWVHIGEVLGDVAIEDVLGLRAELDWLAENAGGGDTSITIPLSFTRGVESMRFLFGRALTINSVSKDANITDLRVGKNGNTAATITFPYSIAASDVIVFEATFSNATVDSYFTLIGEKV